MKQTLQYTLALCLIAAIIIVACKKSSNNATGPATSLNQLFSGLRSTPQGIDVTAGRDTIVYGANGTMLHFYPYSFQDANGTIITSGTINIQLVEMYKPGDMICNRTSCTANGQLLQSTGQINISAVQNGLGVSINRYGVGFKQSSPSNVPMTVFYGNSNNADSVIKWVVSDTTKPGSTASGTYTGTDTTGGTGGTAGASIVYITPNLYVFDTTINAGWVNSDRIYWPLNNYTPTTVSVVLPNSTYTPGNTQIYLVLPSINCVLIIRGGYDASTNTISLNDDGNTVPVGMNYEMAVIANLSGSYYFYETSGVTTNGLTVNATLSPETQGDIKDRLGGL